MQSHIAGGQATVNALYCVPEDGTKPNKYTWKTIWATICIIASLIVEKRRGNLKHDKLGRPVVMTTIEGKNVLALWDSGASASLMTKKVFDTLPHSAKAMQVKPPSHVRTANGTVIDTFGAYRVKVKIKTQTVTLEVIVTDNSMSPGFILGIDAMIKSKLAYNPISRSVDAWPDMTKDSLQKDGHRWKTGKLLIRNRVIVQPQSSKAISVAVVTDQGTLPATAEIVASIQDNAFLCKVGANGATIVRWINASDEPITFQRGQLVGLAENTDDLDFFENEQISSEVHAVTSQKAPPPKEAELWIRDVMKSAVKSKDNNARAAYVAWALTNWDIISLNKYDVGNTPDFNMNIVPRDSETVFRKQFPIPEAHEDHIRNEVHNWLKMGLIQKSSSPHNSPIFCVPKKDPSGNSTYRVVLDYRLLNSHSLESKFCHRNIEECMAGIGKAKPNCFSALDIRSSFYHMTMGKDSRKLTAFTVPGMDSYEWTRAPFGLAGCPGNFARLMQAAVGSIKNVITYIDDICIYSHGDKDNVSTLNEVATRLRKFGLKLNLEKCVFGTEELQYLGYTLSPKGVKPGTDKTKAIRDTPPPDTKKKVRAFVGLANFFRKAVPNFSKLSQHLTGLTTNTTQWKGGRLPPKAMHAYEEIKNILVSRPLLAYPDPTKKYYLMVDAATGSPEEKGGLGACLMQKDDDGEPMPIAYASRCLKKHEENYTPFLLEMQSALWATEHFETRLRDKHFFLMTDHHPLTMLNTNQTKTLNRLQQRMLELNFTVVATPGKLNACADYLSRTATVTDKATAAAIIVNNFESVSRSVDSADSLAIPLALTGISRDDLLYEQTIDPVCVELTNLMNHGQYDPAIVSHSAATVVEGKLMAYKAVLCANLKPKGHLPRRCIILPKALQYKAIVAAHNTAVAGHGGQYQTMHRILGSFWWPGILQDVRTHITSCEPCQRSRRVTRPRPLPLNPLPQCVVPNDRVHIDLFGPLKKEDDTTAYILVATDSMSKMTEVKEIPNKNAATVAKAFVNIWCLRYGVPKTVVSDRGQEMAGNVTEEVLRLLKAKHNMTAPMHAACNAQAEVFNKTIAKYIRAMCDNETKNWSDLLTALVFSYNTTIHKAIRMAPSHLLYGYNPAMPQFDLESITGEPMAQAIIDNIAKAQKTARDLAIENNTEFRDKYKEHHDQSKKVQPHTFKQGMLVLLRQPHKPGINRKFAQPWEGPYLITALIGLENARLLQQSTGRTHVVNVERLQLFRKTKADTKQLLEGWVNLDKQYDQEVIEENETQVDDAQEEQHQDPQVQSHPREDEGDPISFLYNLAKPSDRVQVVPQLTNIPLMQDVRPPRVPKHTHIPAERHDATYDVGHPVTDRYRLLHQDPSFIFNQTGELQWDGAFDQHQLSAPADFIGAGQQLEPHSVYDKDWIPARLGQTDSRGLVGYHTKSPQELNRVADLLEEEQRERERERERGRAMMGFAETSESQPTEYLSPIPEHTHAGPILYSSNGDSPDENILESTVLPAQAEGPVQAEGQFQRVKKGFKAFTKKLQHHAHSHHKAKQHTDTQKSDDDTTLTTSQVEFREQTQRLEESGQGEESRLDLVRPNLDNGRLQQSRDSFYSHTQLSPPPAAHPTHAAPPIQSSDSAQPILDTTRLARAHEKPPTVVRPVVPQPGSAAARPVVPQPGSATARPSTRQHPKSILPGLP